MMDVELHHVLDMVGDVQEVLLLVHTVGVDIPHRGVCSHLDPQ
jgi:hypothetical protein